MVLISAVGFGSGGWGVWARGAAALLTERGGARPRSRRSKQIRRSGGQIDPGLGRLCRGSPRRGAELGGGARRRAVLCGRGYATGYAILHKRTRRLMRCSPGSETKEGPVGGELRRRVAGGARWRGTAVEFQASGLPGSTPGRAVRVKRGLGWSGGRRWHGNRGGRATYRRCVPGEIPGAA